MANDRAIKKWITAKKLRKMKKEELINILIPLIEKATKVNEYWVNEGRKRNISLDKCLELTSDIWAALRDLHCDYWKEGENHGRSKKITRSGNPV